MTVKLTKSMKDALMSAAQDAVTTSTDRRGTQIRDTRTVAARLGASAVYLFDRRSFDEVTVADIASDAGVTGRTFFRYFPTKETVITDIFDRSNDRLVDLIATVGGNSIFTVIQTATHVWLEEFEYLMSALARMSAQSASLNGALMIRSADWEDHLAHALRERFPGEHPDDPDLCAHVAMTLLRLADKKAQPSGLRQPEVADRLFSSLRRITSGDGVEAPAW